MKEADVLLPLFPETKIAHKVMALMPTLMVGMKTLFTFSDNSGIKTIRVKFSKHVRHAKV